MNLGRDSNVDSYSISEDSITVMFRGGGTYLYTYGCPGAYDVEQMKELAEQGEGLNSYINRKVKKNYAARLN